MGQLNVKRDVEFSRLTPGATPDTYQNEDGYAWMAYGTVVPTDTTAGYLTGCFFQQTDGVAGTSFYVNEGSVTSSAFVAVATSSTLGSYLPLAGGTLADGANIALNTTTGTKIGTGITQKLGFYNATPIAQRAGADQAAIVTTAATQASPWGFATQAQADAIVTLANELRAWAVAQGFIKGSA